MFTVLFPSFSQGQRTITVYTWDFLQLGERISQYHCKLTITKSSVQQHCLICDFCLWGTFPFGSTFPPRCLQEVISIGSRGVSWDKEGTSLIFNWIILTWKFIEKVFRSVCPFHTLQIELVHLLLMGDE